MAVSRSSNSIRSQPAFSQVTLLQRMTSRKYMGYWLILPLALIVVGLVVYPFFSSIHLSMLNKKEVKFVGTYNYERLLGIGRIKGKLFNFGNLFWMVVGNSLRYTAIAVFLKSALGLTLAMIINCLPSRGQRFWRGVALVPWVMPLSMSALGWWWMFDPAYSGINWILRGVLGMEDIPWLADPFWARVAVTQTNIWMGIPFFMIMYLAGLQSIPEELYEASEIDGANALQRFRHITVPLLASIIAITIMFSLIMTFAEFDIIRVMTRGGPRYSTHIFGTFSFLEGIENGNVPRGAAVSLFMFPFLFIMAVVVLRSVRGSKS